MNKKCYKIITLFLALSLYALSAVTCLASGRDGAENESKESEIFHMEEFENPLKDGQTIEDEELVPKEGEMLFEIEDGGVGKKAKAMPKKIVLSHKKLVLHVEETEKLSVIKVKPKTASAKVLWFSGNKKVAAVSKAGKVTAKKAGRTTITAVSRKNPHVKAVIKLTVKK